MAIKGKVVTLIGGGGFLGRYIAQALFDRGARVRIAQRSPKGAFFIKPLGGLGQTQFVAADVRKPDTVAQAITGSDAVVNLVGVLTGDFQAFHVDGARHVAEAATAHGVESLIHISAIGADAASPSAYGRSKAEGEAAVRAAFPGAIILRPSIVFGREDQFINRFAGMISAAPVVPVLRPETRFQPIYVVDLAEAVATALDDPARYAGRTFELGGPDVVSMGELIHWIAKATGRDPLIAPLPDALGATIARAGFLPGAPITWDQWQMLQRDNVVSADAPGLNAFGVRATPMATVAPTWLVRFRRGGRFAARTA